MPLDLTGKFNFLVYSSFVTAPFSLVASSLALLTVFRSSSTAGGRPNIIKRRTYQRLICGISIFDIILSLGFALGPLPMLEETGRPGARGNTATCNFQGFLLQLGCASFIYSLMLMIYFVLVIRYRMSEQTIATRIEPFMHLIPILFYGASALAGIPLQVYNPNGVWCWVAHWPMDCAMRGVECTRGGKWVDIYGTFFFIGPLFVVVFLIVVCLLIVAITVCQRYREAVGLYDRGATVWQRFRGGAAQRRRQGSTTSPATKRTKQVIVQCFLHGFSFVNMLIWNCIQTIYYWKGKPFDEFGKHYFIMAIGIFFFPLQGLFNFMIFIRPRYLKNREVFNNRSRWFAFVQAVWNSPGATNSSPPPPTRRRRQRPEVESSMAGRGPSSPRNNRSSGLLTTVALTVSRTTGRLSSSAADMKSNLDDDGYDNDNQGADNNIDGSHDIKNEERPQEQSGATSCTVSGSTDHEQPENNDAYAADDEDSPPPSNVGPPQLSCSVETQEHEPVSMRDNDEDAAMDTSPMDRSSTDAILGQVDNALSHHLHKENDEQ